MTGSAERHPVGTLPLPLASELLYTNIIVPEITIVVYAVRISLSAKCSTTLSMPEKKRSSFGYIRDMNRSDHGKTEKMEGIGLLLTISLFYVTLAGAVCTCI